MRIKKTYFFFLDVSEARQALSDLKNYIDNRIPSFCDTQVKRIPKYSGYGFSVNLFEIEPFLYRAALSVARVVAKPEKYIIKTIRLDEKNYFRRFLEMVLPPYKHYPLRNKPKRNFTVTGKGVFLRPKADADEDISKTINSNLIPYKQKQYAKEEKSQYSKAQSCSLGLKDFSPRAFGFDKRADLAGVLIPWNHVLPTDRNIKYDGGTVNRPYDFDEFKQAADYYYRKHQSILFSADEISEFENNVITNEQTYNEMLSRLRFSLDEKSMIMAAGDSRASRLWAIEYQRLLLDYVKTHNIPRQSDNVPVILYHRDQPEAHFRIYSDELQTLDIYYTRLQYEQDSNFFHKHYLNLIGLSLIYIEELFRRKVNGKNFLLQIIANGYVHVVQSIFERASDSSKQHLTQILKNALSLPENKPLLMNALASCLESHYFEFADLILEQIKDTHHSYSKNALLIAIEKNQIDWVNKLMSYNKTNFLLLSTDLTISLKPPEALAGIIEKGSVDMLRTVLRQSPFISTINDKYKNITPLIQAVKIGKLEIIKTLLELRNIDVNATSDDDEGYSALGWAIFHGRINTTKLLLSDKRLNINQRFKDGSSALLIAVMRIKIQHLSALIQRPDLEINYSRIKWCYSGINYYVINCKNMKMFDLIYQHKNFDPNYPCLDKITYKKIDDNYPLYSALSNGEITMAIKLSKHPKFFPQCHDSRCMTFIAQLYSEYQQPELATSLIKKYLSSLQHENASTFMYRLFNITSLSAQLTNLLINHLEKDQPLRREDLKSHEKAIASCHLNDLVNFLCERSQNNNQLKQAAQC